MTLDITARPCPYLHSDTKRIQDILVQYAVLGYQKHHHDGHEYVPHVVGLRHRPHAVADANADGADYFMRDGCQVLWGNLAAKNLHLHLQMTYGKGR